MLAWLRIGITAYMTLRPSSRRTVSILALSLLLLSAPASAQGLGNLFSDFFLTDQSKTCIDAVKQNLSVRPGWLKTLAIEEVRPRGVARGKVDGRPGVIVTGLLDITGTFEVPDHVVDCYMVENQVRLGQKPESAMTQQCRATLNRVNLETDYFNKELGFRLGDGRASHGRVQFTCQFPNEEARKVERIEPLRNGHTK